MLRFFFTHPRLRGLVLQTVDLPVEKRAGFDYGEQISFTFDPELAHLFSSETEKNLI